MAAYEVVIGLEVHAQLLSRTKAFCPVAQTFAAPENSCVGPVSAGLPGALPVLNKEAVKLAVRAGLALNCSIQQKSQFARKNYFYPDSPKGYQISQFDEPICTNGYLEIESGDERRKKKIHIERIHMEDDAGKSIHQASYTLVNLNRAGVPLIEIVSKPDLRGPQEAVDYLKRLHAILVYADICDGNLEEGNFRCDVNLSIRRMGETKLGTRAELKNINSFRFVEKAIEYEIARQISVVEAGGKVVQETRGWDSAAGKTFSMRSKENAHDYRYFPDPDLPPLKLKPEFIADIKQNMPELPEQRKQRYITQYSLPEYDADVLTSEKALASYFDETVAQGAPPKQASNWIMSELLGLLKEKNLSVAQCNLSPQNLTKLIQLVEKGTISGKMAKEIFNELYDGNQDPELVVKEKGLIQISDPAQIESWVDEAIHKNPSQVAEYKSGRTKMFGFFVGQIMKTSQGKANPNLVSEILTRKLNS